MTHDMVEPLESNNDVDTTPAQLLSTHTPKPSIGSVSGAAAVLIAVNLLNLIAAVAAQRGEAGTEFTALVLFPFQAIAFLMVIGSLLATSFRREPLASDVRRRRLVISTLALTSTFLPYLVENI